MWYFWQLLKHDLREQMIKRWYYFLLILPLIFYLCIDFGNIIEGIGKNPNFMDMLIWIFYGVKEYIPSENPFEIKIEFMLIYIVPACIIAYYPIKDLSVSGRQIFIRIRNNTIWWFSKCVWLILTIVLYYLMVYACIAAVAGDVMLLPHKEVLIYMGVAEEVKSAGEYLIFLVLLPIVTTVAVSFVQMFLSVITAPAYGFFAVVLNLLLSSYFYSHWIPGNFLMFNRNILAREGGIGFEQSLAVNVVLVIVCMIAGAIYMKKKDLL
ncbi:MAG: hypothetical protein HFH65_08785 [Lachnospiraceae bacterium]|nr:hypothetical protein [Lachnospiraceae bacterium]